MRKEQDLQIDVLRAQKAAELLENDILKEALSVIESEVVAAWGEAPARDKEGKEELWRVYKTSQKFRAVLNGYIESGKLAKSMLAQHEKESAIRRLFAA